MPVYDANASAQSIDLQSEFIGIKEWTCEPAKLGLTPKEIEKRLNIVEDQFSEPRVTSHVFDSYELLQALIGSFEAHPESVRLKLLGAVITGLGKLEAFLEKQMEGCMEDDGYGQALGAYTVLLVGLLQAAERASHATSNAKKSGKAFDWNHLKVQAIDTIRRCLALELTRLIPAQANREAIVSNLVKGTHALLENPLGLKLTGVKRAVQEVWVLAVARHGYASGMQSLILQDIQYFEALMEPMAEFAALLSIQQDGASAMVQDVLEAIGAHSYAASETGAIRNVSSFILGLAKAAPREIVRALPSLIGQLDSESYTLRCTMVELLGILLTHLNSSESKSEEEEGKSRSLLGVLEERLLDVNAFVRSRVIQVFAEGLRSGWLPITQRSRILAQLLHRLRDKSSNVRRKAIQVLSDFLRTHPFCVEGGELSLKYFEQRLDEIDSLLADVKVDEPSSEPDQEDVEMTPAKTPGSAPKLSSEQISTLLLQKRYYTDAIQFTRQLEAVLPTLCQLLGSSVKAEAGDVIDFFVEAHAYRMDGAPAGLRRMMHLIWDGSVNQAVSEGDEAKHSVREHLLAAYKRVYLETEVGLAGKAKCEQIALNLLDMVRGASLAELASLEPILLAMQQRRWLPDGVLLALFTFLPAGGEQRRGALVLLGLLAAGGSQRDLLAARLDVLLRAGFAPDTDPVAAQSTLKAVRGLASGGASSRLSVDNPIFSRMVDFIRAAPLGPAWLEPIAEALRTVYALADTPGKISEELLQELHTELFESMEETVSIAELTRLLHIVGVVAAAESSHLDTIERHWKASRETQSKKEISELDMIAGVDASTPEDDFADAVAQVRDQELLHGQNSLLAVYGPVVACIAGNQTDFPDSSLQRVTSLLLAKFMAISSSYCQQHLALFLTILERSQDSVVRCNLVIAFADLLQAFSRIIDDNISFLFARLSDPNSAVRRSTLLVLTHLTLTGRVKVKGQIGELAKCLLDEDERIANLSRVFFHEIASKDPAIIYNHLPDILSTLTVSAIPEDDFQSIMRFVIEFIKKERQLESLLEKLCQRFRLCTTSRQSRDVAFCLSLLSFSSERSVRKLMDAFPLYQDKLADGETFRLFAEILVKAKKSCRGGVLLQASADDKAQPAASASEVKTLFEEFEARLLRAAGQSGNMMDIDDPEGDVFDPSQLTGKKAASQKTRKKPARSKKFQLTSSEDEENDLQSGEGEVESGVESGEEAIPQPKTREKIKLARRQGLAKPTLCDF